MCAAFSRAANKYPPRFPTLPGIYFTGIILKVFPYLITQLWGAMP
jgi:hypothetical protein